MHSERQRSERVVIEKATIFNMWDKNLSSNIKNKMPFAQSTHAHLHQQTDAQTKKSQVI